jgi:hypothetical protein
MENLTRAPRTRLLGAMAIVILIAELFANEIIAGDEGDDDIGGWIGLSLFGIAVMLVLVLVVVPRIKGADRRNAVLGFWSALPFAFAAAALAAASPADDAPEGEQPAPSTAGVLLAVLATVAAFVFCLIG